MNPAMRVVAASVVLLLGTTACGDPGSDGAARVSEAPTARPPEACEALWSSEAATAFVDGLARATLPREPIWAGYEAADGAFVLHAGASETGSACVGLWRAGQAVAFAALAEEPALLTPLYGYYLTFADTVAMGGLVPRSRQPPSVAAWLDGLGVESAVLMPVTIEGLPFEISALQKTQVAVHEAFHVHVQAERWLGGAGAWPDWDRQPDRVASRQCYTATPEVEAALARERGALDSLITALLDGQRGAACAAGQSFFEHRAARYSAARAVRVPLADGTPGSCRHAEAILELEEGTADYVSWPLMVELGLASRETLLQRYNAQQNEAFYLTGAIQLHAIELMRPDDMIEVTRRIAASRSPVEGSITTILAETIGGFCAAG